MPIIVITKRNSNFDSIHFIPSRKKCEVKPEVKSILNFLDAEENSLWNSLQNSQVMVDRHPDSAVSKVILERRRHEWGAVLGVNTRLHLAIRDGQI